MLKGTEQRNVLGVLNCVGVTRSNRVGLMKALD